MDVILESLVTVKTALSTFRSDIEGISESASSCRQNCLQECNGCIAKTKMQIEKYETEEMHLTQKIKEAEREIESARYKVQKIDGRIPVLNQQQKSMNADLDQMRIVCLTFKNCWRTRKTERKTGDTKTNQ